MHSLTSTKKLCILALHISSLTSDGNQYLYSRNSWCTWTRRAGLWSSGFWYTRLKEMRPDHRSFSCWKHSVWLPWHQVYWHERLKRTPVDHASTSWKATKAWLYSPAFTSCQTSYTKLINNMKELTQTRKSWRVSVTDTGYFSIWPLFSISSNPINLPVANC